MAFALLLGRCISLAVRSSWIWAMYSAIWLYKRCMAGGVFGSRMEFLYMDDTLVWLLARAAHKTPNKMIVTIHVY